jgi:O-antigen/teichoic acid export membrane protein
MLHTFVNRCARIWKEARWVILGQFAAFVGAIATVKLLTTELGPSMYGQLTLAVSIAGALQLFVYGPLNQIVIRYFSIYYDRGKLSVYFHVLRKIYLYVGLLVTLITAVVFTAFLAWWNSEWALFVLLAVIYGCMNGMQAGVCAYYDATRNRKKSAAFQSFSIWARLLFALLLFYLLEVSTYNALLGFCLGVLVVSLLQISGLQEAIAEHKGVQHEPFSDYKYVAECLSEFKKYSFPFLLFALVGMFGAYADRWIIFERLGEKDVGIYVALYQIANAPVALVMAFAQQYSAPIIFQRAGSAESTDQATNAERLLLYMVFAFVVVLLPLILLFWIYSEEIVGIFTSESFMEHHELLWFLPFGIMGFSVGQLFILKGQYLNKPMVYLWPKILHALSLVVLTYYLVTEAGIIGAAYAFCVASMIYLSVIILVNRKLS